MISARFLPGLIRVQGSAGGVDPVPDLRRSIFVTLLHIPGAPILAQPLKYLKMSAISGRGTWIPVLQIF